MRTKHTSKLSPAQAIRRAAIETLEPRRMLAVFDANASNNSIFIAKSVDNTLTHVVINGTDHTTTDLTITVNALGGNDSIDVQSTRSGSHITVNGGDGNDFLQNTVSDLDAVFPGDFTFVGGNGTDALAADNGTDTASGGSFLIQADSIFRESPSAKFLIHYGEIESLDYADNDNSNTIQFINLQGPQHDIANVTIRGHGGNDTIRNFRTSASGYWPSSFGTGGVTVDAGPGTDLIALSDAADLAVSCTMTANSIAVNSAFDDGGPLGYVNCESIDFLGTPSGELVTLSGKPSGASLRFDSGGGNDSYAVGGGDFDANGFLLANTTLLGGAGADSIEYLDGADFASDTYTWGTSSLARATFGFNASSFETRTLQASNGLTISALNTINLNTMASDVISTTIFGGGGGAGTSVVNVTQGSLGSLFGSLDVDADQLIINDQNSGGPVNGYQVSPGFVSKNNTNQIINYSGVGKITLNTSGVFDVVNATGTSAGTALALNTNGGDDVINIGSGNLDVDFGGAVTVNGGAGLNDVSIRNDSDPTLETMTLNGGTLIDNFSHTFSSVNGFNISLGPGGTNMTVNSVIPKTGVVGGSGNDTFTVGGGNIAANFPAPVPSAPSFNGGGGTDAIILNDINGAGVGGSYTFERPAGIDRLARGVGTIWFINWANMESATLEASDLATSGTATADIFVFQSLTPIRVNGNGGGDRVFIMDPAHPVIVNTGTGTHDQIEVNLAGGAPCTAIVEQSDEVNGIRINAGGTLRVSEGATLAKSQVSGVSNYFDITGTLDLAGALLSRAGGPTQTQLRNWLIAGRNGGAWDGISASGAINSSLAASSPLSDGVGYGLGSEIIPTTIGPFNIASADTLVRYALDGDTDLSGGVNVADFNRLAANYGQSNRQWVDGDSNYDGLVNVTDFNRLSGNYGQSAALNAFGEQPIRPSSDHRDLRSLPDKLSLRQINHGYAL